VGPSAVNMSKLYLIIQNWWFTKLPEEHTKIQRGDSVWQFILRCFIHPVKRRVAKYYLIILKRLFGLKVIAVTGSAGKTITKEMIASILKQDGRVVWSRANIDPVYNIPSTILRCMPNTKYLVLEMGVEFLGEMDFYLWLVKPDVGVVTNIYYTHTQFLESFENVFDEKSKLVIALSKEGYAVLNREDKATYKLTKKIKSKILFFGDGGDVNASNVQLSTRGTNFKLIIKDRTYNVLIPQAGEQFVKNALAAVATGYVLGVKDDRLLKGLLDVKPEEHRMNIFKHSSGALIVDDSYNSNPLALEKSLLAFKVLGKQRKKIAVLGDMLELGKYEDMFHKQIGINLSLYGINYLIGVGKASKVLVKEAEKKLGRENVFWVESYNKVYKVLFPLINKESAVLIKGSRSIKLDKVADRLSRL